MRDNLGKMHFYNLYSVWSVQDASYMYMQVASVLFSPSTWPSYYHQCSIE